MTEWIPSAIINSQKLYFRTKSSGQDQNLQALRLNNLTDTHQIYLNQTRRAWKDTSCWAEAQGPQPLHTQMEQTQYWLRFPTPEQNQTESLGSPCSDLAGAIRLHRVEASKLLGCCSPATLRRAFPLQATPSLGPISPFTSLLAGTARMPPQRG